jgi:flagellar FliL protein
MAVDETEVAEAVAADRRGLGKTIGLGVGLFLLVALAQLITGIVGCLTLPGLMPGCTAREATAAGKAAPKPEKPRPPPIYQAFDPPLIVSFQDQGSIRFLQATVEVMARDEPSIEAVKTHMPVLRNNLLNILSDKRLAELTSRDGKEALRKECLAEVQKVLKANATKQQPLIVEDLYFTSFVVQ